MKNALLTGLILVFACNAAVAADGDSVMQRFTLIPKPRQSISCREA